MMIWWLFVLPLVCALPLVAADQWDHVEDAVKRIFPPEDKK